MENNLNNKSAQNRANSTAQNGNNSSASDSMNRNQSAQGRSNQQATTGKGGMKNIQDMLQQYSGPIAKKVNNLSTTQKIVGGSLLALGAGWIAMNSGNKEKIKSKANELTSSAKQKMNARKGNDSMDNSSRSNSSSSNPTRTGSSAVDARVK